MFTLPMAEMQPHGIGDAQCAPKVAPSRKFPLHYQINTRKSSHPEACRACHLAEVLPVHIPNTNPRDDSSPKSNITPPLTLYKIKNITILKKICPFWPKYQK
jgi:hypothetical protein